MVYRHSKANKCDQSLQLTVWRNDDKMQYSIGSVYLESDFNVYDVMTGGDTVT